MRKAALLTIDDGPSIDRPLLLEALAQRGVQAVFFSEGRYLEQRPELGLATLRAGHHLGNHSWSHLPFSDLTVVQARDEIQRTQVCIAKLYTVAGQTQPEHWFRFPYGDTGDGRRGYVLSWWRRKDAKKWQQIQDTLRALGYTHIAAPELLPPWYATLHHGADTHWTFDPMEWSLNQEKPVLGVHDIHAVLHRIQQNYPKDIRGLLPWHPRWRSAPATSEIIVMHDQAGLGKHFGEILDALMEVVHFVPISPASQSVGT